ncbi:MAG: quinol:cytochrome C oxidoreductase [Planctomycetota bacterium]
MSHPASTELTLERVPMMGEAGRGKIKLIALIGIVLVVVAVVLGLTTEDGKRHLSFAWLVGATFVLSIGLGGMFFVLLQHLTRSGWSVVLRRIAENAMWTIPIAGLMFLPIVIPTVFGYSGLFPWIDAAWAEADPVVSKKTGYLNMPFFVARYVFYFTVWIFMARYFRKASLTQDQTRDPAITTRLQSRAAPGMLVFALTATFASFDFIMSLEPHWFSTIFGVYFFAGCTLSIYSTMILAAFFLSKNPDFGHLVTKEHYHDLGKWLFGFVFFWSYIAFSQFMLYWYANIPEETEWLVHRQNHGWGYWSLVLIFGHCLIPFGGLLSRHVKRNKKVLSCWAVWLLLMQMVDLFWLIRPLMNSHGVHFGLIDVATVFGLAFIGLAYGMQLTSKQPLIAHGDPRLRESLELVVQ